MNLPEGYFAGAGSVLDSPQTNRRARFRPVLVEPDDWPPFADTPYEGPEDAEELLYGDFAPATPQAAWITAAELQGRSFPPVEWVVPGYLPAGLTLLAGRPKLGKSWLTLDWCVNVARGGYTLSNERACPGGDVLYLALEDNERRLQERLRKVLGSGGAWPERLTLTTSLSPSDPQGLATVERWLGEARAPRLICVDTLAKVRPAKGRGDDAYAADYAAVSPWKATADKHNVGVVAVHHVRKMHADDPLEMVSGTNGLTGAADTILVLNRDGQGCTLIGRGRDLEEFERAVTFDRQTCRWSVLGEATEVRRSAERNAVLRHVEGAGVQGLTPAELAEADEFSRDGAKQILRRMARDGELGRGERRGSYVLATPPR
jgi:hypothetical protein